MPNLYQRARGLVDLFLEKVYRKKVVIRDGTTDTGTYYVTLNGVTFQFDDPASGADNAAAIATGLAGLITASDLEITATAVANVLILQSDRRGVDFSISTFTTDTDGSLYVQDACPEIYRVKSAANWDGVFADIQDVPMWGLATPRVGASPTAQRLEPYARWRFHPSDYGLEDDDVLYFQIAPVADGVEQAAGPIYILMTPEQMTENHSPLILSGSVPAAGSSDEALEFTLPAQSTSLVVTNLDAATDLYLSFGTGDAEIPLAPGDSFRDNRFGSGDIRLRGDGAAAEVSVYVTLNFQRFL